MRRRDGLKIKDKPTHFRRGDDTRVDGTKSFVLIRWHLISWPSHTGSKRTSAYIMLIVCVYRPIYTGYTHTRVYICIKCVCAVSLVSLTEPIYLFIPPPRPVYISLSPFGFLVMMMTMRDWELVKSLANPPITSTS